MDRRGRTMAVAKIAELVAIEQPLRLAGDRHRAGQGVGGVGPVDAGLDCTAPAVLHAHVRALDEADLEITLLVAGDGEDVKLVPLGGGSARQGAPRSDRGRQRAGMPPRRESRSA